MKALLISLAKNAKSNLTLKNTIEFMILFYFEKYNMNLTDWFVGELLKKYRSI